MSKPTFKTKKSEQTFERVFEAAIKLFIERGYEKTTMRDISAASGLGLGALYYYFSSKEQVVLHFYEQVNERVAQQFSEAPISPNLAMAFADLMRLKLEALGPHRHLLRVIIKEAVDPESPLCPLSTETHQPRDVSLSLFHDIAKREVKAKAQLEESEQMARGLWFLHMGLLGYWLHDKSEGYAATYRAIETAALALTWSTRLTKVPGFSPLRKRVLSLVGGLFDQGRDVKAAPEAAV